MRKVAPLAPWLLPLLLALPARGDGFHSPLLRNPDPAKWARTERERLGLDRSDSTDPGGGGDAGFARRRAAKQLLDVLRYLDKRNVLLREFPDFNYENIPGFKSQTEALLIALGKEAVPLVLATLVADLKGNAAPQAQFADLKRAEDLIERLVRILVAIGEDSLDPVAARLGDPHPRVRKTLLRILREIVVDPDFGKDVEAWKRWHAIRKAGRDRRAGALPEVLAALEDPDRRLRLAAARALGGIGGGKAVPALLAALEESRDEPLTVAIARSLAKIGDLRATPALIDLLESPRRTTRAEAATALRFLTRTMQGFDPRAPAERRAAAVARWREWWEKR